MQRGSPGPEASKQFHTGARASDHRPTITALTFQTGQHERILVRGRGFFLLAKSGQTYIMPQID